jgi:hypothetical protein
VWSLVWIATTPTTDAIAIDGNNNIDDVIKVAKDAICPLPFCPTHRLKAYC